LPCVPGAVFTTSGLDKGVVAEAGVGIGIARLTLERVDDPVLEGIGIVGVAVGVNAASLEEIDHHFVHDVDVSTELECLLAHFL